MDDEVILRIKEARKILEIRRPYGREPTVNELLAVHSLPCLAYSELWDRSQTSDYIDQHLCHLETSGDVSVLEEAGRLLMIQRTAAPQASTTSQRETRIVVPGTAHKQTPGYKYYGNHDLPLRPRPSGMQNPGQNLFTRIHAGEASASNSSHLNDLAISKMAGPVAREMATTNLYNTNHAASNSMTANFPSGLPANYLASLTATENPRPRNIHWPFVDTESAEVAWMNKEMLGGGSL